MTCANATTATLAAIRRAAPQPERHGRSLLVWRADVTDELFPSSSSSPFLDNGGGAAASSLSSSLAPVRSLLLVAFDRRFGAHKADLPDLVASAYAPDCLFSNNLATVVSPANVAAAWRFLAAPFVATGVVGGGPLRVEAVAWAPVPAFQEEEEAGPPAEFGGAGPQAAALSPVVEEAEDGSGARARAPASTKMAPLPPPATASVALVVETEQRWRLFPTLVLVRAVFGDSLRVRVTSTLRLSPPSGGKIAAHADRVEGWWAVPGPLRALLGALAPAVVTALGW